jgi:hypothetical protein
VIDTRDIVQVLDALQLLQGSPALSESDSRRFVQWLSDYLDWLMVRENGKLERVAPNNHGTWYFYQTIAIARYLGRESDALTLARKARARIGFQFAEDGSQPLEIVRANGLGYSVFNLRASFRVAALTEPLGVDLWNYTAWTGASLRRGLEYLLPYNKDPGAWPHNQEKPLEPGFLQPLIDRAMEVWPDFDPNAAPEGTTSTGDPLDE